MSRGRRILEMWEPERYELVAPARYRFDTDRREFFKILGAGILIVCVAKEAAAVQESGGGHRQSGHDLPQEISAWLHIGENGVITGYTGKVEVGQNIRTSLAQGIAEELRVPVGAIRMVMGDTQLTPFDMGTFGSRTTPTMNLQLRKVSAAARDLLLDLAAEEWKVDRKRLVAAGGKITDRETSRSIEYSALVKGRQLAQTLPAEDPLIPPSEWTVAGRSLPKVDGREFVTGKHRYPSDQKLPGMLYGKILWPDAFGAQLVSLDSREAEQIPGVTVVHDGNFVGVAATSEALAGRAIQTMQAQWKSDAQTSNQELFEFLKKNKSAEKPRGEPGDPTPYVVGSIEQGLAAAQHRLNQTYTVAYIAHAPLEPRAALAEWSGDSLTVWTGTQRPFGVREELAAAFRIPEERVRVLMPDTGSAYGGKHTGDAAVEAARLARAAGKPVKVVWTREEEFTWAYFRPAGVMEISAGISSDGKITAWEYHNYNSGASAIRTYYDIPNQHIEFHLSRSPLRQGSYRGLAATANHFARESFMDELAHAAGLDPLEFRMRNLIDERFRAVYRAAAEKFGWGRAKSGPGIGFGIAGGFEKGSYVATCAEVVVDRASGDVKVTRVVTAFECGAIVNPDNLKNQVEGSNIQGLGGALFEAVQFENGRILNARFSRYRVPRFSDIPAMETVLLNRKDIPPAGAGETTIVGIAPAVGNAIFDATGVRLRAMPLVPNGLKSA
ncbi:MAG TPA: molybdopterin cofactor-binding domain-containing protein [Candidatus Sulfotelmatobacter sp.]|nr:molybdopterin cofactor-binding domain-containing protein [Candidatus Sulfotelmatobacter sp.]